MTEWHPSVDAVERYADASAGPELAASVEAHLMLCVDCRSRLGARVDRDRAAAIWSGVVDVVDTPRRTPFEWLLTRFGVSSETARLVGTTPALRGPWLASIAVALAFVAFAANADRRGLWLFLGVAPLAPLAGVAFAFASGLDHTREIGLATPYSGLRLLLLRSAAVLGLTVALTAVVGLATPGPAWLAAVWLLPSLGLVSSTLALASRVPPALAAGAMGGGWACALIGFGLRGRVSLLFEPPAQIGWLVLVLAGALVLTVRRQSYVIRLGRTS